MKTTHPIDPFLARHKWRRATIDDITANPFAVRLICRPIGLRAIVVVDVKLRMQGPRIYTNIVTQPIPQIVSQIAREGQRGTSPIAVGLTPCDCPRTATGRWNPLMLPLAWQPDMDNLPLFNTVLGRYATLLQQPEWQCLGAGSAARL
jgi:hypothetical protein